MGFSSADARGVQTTMGCSSLWEKTNFTWHWKLEPSQNVSKRHKTMQSIFSEYRPCGETAGCKSTWRHTWVDSGHIACLLSRILRFAKSKLKTRTLTKWSGLPVGAQCALQKTQQSWLHMKRVSFLLLVDLLQARSTCINMEI